METTAQTVGCLIGALLGVVAAHYGGANSAIGFTLFGAAGGGMGALAAKAYEAIRDR